MCDVKKQCAVCKQNIEIDIYNIQNIARANAKYYHPECLKEYAQKLIQRPKHASVWDSVVNNIQECEREAKEIIYKRYWQDLLNEHLLKHYDVATMPDRFWEMIMDLHNGIRKGKKCKPIHMETLCGTWIWGQTKLDAINRNNKQKKQGPKNDSERVNYDLSIVLNHIEDYKKYIAKLKAEEAEREARAKEAVKINYNNINNTQVESEGLDDISDLLDEI